MVHYSEHGSFYSPLVPEAVNHLTSSDKNVEIFTKSLHFGEYLYILRPDVDEWY